MSIRFKFVAIWLGLCIVLSLAGCTDDPPIVRETESVSNIVIKYQGYNRCDYPEATTETLTVMHVTSHETTWGLEGEVKVGGEVKVAWWQPAFKIEAAMTARYGERTTEDWEEVQSKTWKVAAGSQVLYVGYWRELHRRGEIETGGKIITYDYPEQLVPIGDTVIDLPCDPLVLYPVCGFMGGFVPPVDPVIPNLDKSWHPADSEAGEITRLDLTFRDPYLIFHAYTTCDSGECDWGEQVVCYFKQPLAVTYDLKFKTTTLTVKGLEDGVLSVEVLDRFLNPPTNLADREAVYQFK
ncbi:MAG: hypothetical protein HY870_19485 [Chloroflexi bacterium]|nr:hypothetical protein [Chloroflexota bacterium]